MFSGVALLHALTMPFSSIVPGIRRCSISSCERELAAVRLQYSRPVRALLQPARRSDLLQLERDRTLASLHAALSARLPRNVAVPTDVFFVHGRRKIESDTDLAEVLSSAAAHGHGPLLRVETSDALEAAIAAAAVEAAAAVATAAAAASAAEAAELAAGPKQLLTFYTFCEVSEGRLPLLLLQLQQALSRLGARGSVYVAPEGLNAQLALPTSRVAELRIAFGSIPELSGTGLNLGVQVYRVYLRVSVRARACVRVCVCACIYIYMHMYMHIHIHIYLHLYPYLYLYLSI